MSKHLRPSLQLSLFVVWGFLALVWPAFAIGQGDMLICSPDTSSVKRLDRDTGQIIGDFVTSGSGGLLFPSGLAFGPDGNLYVSDGPNGTILRFQGQTGAFIDLFAQDSSLFGPTDMVFHDGKLFVGMWSNGPGLAGGVARLNGTTGALEDTIGVQNSHRVSSIEIDAQGELFASSFDSSDIRVYDPLTGDLIRTLGNFNTLGRPMGMSFGSDGNLYVNDWTGSFRIVDPQTGTLIRVLLTGIGANQSNQFAPDATLIVDRFFARTLEKYDPNTGQLLGTFATLPGQLEKFIFMPETELIPICADAGNLLEGSGQVNDFQAACGSDDVRWAAHGATFAFQVSDPVVQFELNAEVPVGWAEQAIRVSIEASKQAGQANLNLRALIFNFATQSYQALPGVMQLTVTDAVQSFSLPAGSDASEFVNPNDNHVLLLVQAIQTSGTPNVRVQLDEILFEFE